MTDTVLSQSRDPPTVAVVIFAIAAVCFVKVSGAEDEIWKNCSTPGMHYVLQIPGSLVRSAGPGISGCTYQTADGEFTVEAVEQTDNQTLDARMQKELDLLKGTVTDQKRDNDWFAITGVTSDKTEYYRIHYTNGAQWVTLRITYPRDKNKKYDKWVERIDKSFVAFSGAQQKIDADQAKRPQDSGARRVEKSQRTEESSPPARQVSPSPEEED